MSISNSLKNAELNKQIFELSTLLLSTIDEILILKDDLYNKNKKIDSLNEIIRLKKESSVWKSPFYYLKLENCELDGPFCQKCFDSIDKAIRVYPLGNGCYRCANCDNIFDPEAEKRFQQSSQPRRLIY